MAATLRKLVEERKRNNLCLRCGYPLTEEDLEAHKTRCEGCRDLAYEENQRQEIQKNGIWSDDKMRSIRNSLGCDPETGKKLNVETSCRNCPMALNRSKQDGPLFCPSPEGGCIQKVLLIAAGRRNDAVGYGIRSG